MKKNVTLLFTLFSFLLFSQQEIPMQNGIFNSCNSLFTDSGGSDGFYESNEDFTITFCPEFEGDSVSLNFLEFATQLNIDILTIYDGDSVSEPTIGTYSGVYSPGLISANNATGCLTVHFSSNPSGHTTGWIAEVNCTPGFAINQPSDYILCELGGDGFGDFDLTAKDFEILGTLDPSSYQVTYHLTQIDAESQMNALVSPFTNMTNPQTVYAAVTEFSTGNIQITSFDLFVDTTCGPCQTITASIDSTVPAANISNVVVVSVGNDVTFNGSATFSEDDTNANYNWNLGDDNTASGTSVVHQYTQEGSYTVTFTATDDNPQGCFGSTTIEVLVIGNYLTVDQTQFTVQELVKNVLIGNECSSISNVISSTGSDFGDANGIGYFVYEGSNFPFSEGLLITTGNAESAEGPEEGTLSDGSQSWPGDIDLETVIPDLDPGSTNNASFIQFDFVPVVDQINFNFLFASEEYGTFQCAFTDAFAFLLTNNETGITENIAVVPGTNDVVSVLTVRDDTYNGSCSSVNPEFFGSYYGTPNGLPVDDSPIDFRGHTTSMTAQSPVIPGTNYTIKLVIADASDTLYDAAVFFEAGSFDVGGICDEIGVITVNAFNDVNTNGSFDADETNFTNGSFTYEKNNDGIVNVVSSSNGSFTIISENETDTYDITYTINDDYTDCYSQTVTSFDDVNVSFGEVAQVEFPVEDNLMCQDLAVYLVNPLLPPRPGFEHTNLLILENLTGATIASGSVEFTLDDNLLINATSVSNSNLSVTTTVTGFTLDFTNLEPGSSEHVEITLSCPATVPLDTIVTNTATYTTDENDTVSENNNSSLSEVVVGAYDPNDKMESHGREIVYDDFVTSDEWLYYTIRFQNLGTFFAQDVRIEDELNEQLDETTFQMLRSSHDYVVTRTDSSLEWFFEDINLPAEQDDEPGSHGYVYFRIKPKSGYAVGDIIPNSAAIYFDFNAPVITNTFETEFVAPLSVDEFNTSDFELYPNPVHDILNLQFNRTGSYNIIVIDLQGKTVLNTLIEEAFTQIDVSNLDSGVYFVKVMSKNSITTKKLVIQ